MIRTIEEHALNAWPALNQLLYDGWVLRFSNGYTKRANSVNVLHTGQQDVAHKIRHCIDIYRDQNLPPVFRITPLAEAERLDHLLAADGFDKQSLTSVHTLDLTHCPVDPTPNFYYWPAYSPEWETHFVHFKGVPAQRETHQVMLQSILPQTCFAVIRHDDTLVACGLGVLDDNYVGLFDLITAKAARRQGFGRQLITNILHWATTKGATTAYLQVEVENIPALNLYTKLGFEEVYQYWYRVKI